MPNHITTELEITGTKGKIAELVEKTGLRLTPSAANNKFDFNGIIKMPDELNITSGSNVSLALIAWGGKEPNGVFSSFESYQKMPWWEDRYPGIDTPEKLLAHLKEHDRKSYDEGKQAFDNLEKYGYKDWYDWSIAYWGTKWNAYDVEYLDGDDTRLHFRITTAWSWPQPIFDELERQGYTVKGVAYGEMDGYEYIGEDASSVFDAYQDVIVEYNGATSD